jgi:hypothetical protein
MRQPKIAPELVVVTQKKKEPKKSERLKTTTASQWPNFSRP